MEGKVNYNYHIVDIADDNDSRQGRVEPFQQALKGPQIPNSNDA